MSIVSGPPQPTGTPPLYVQVDAVAADAGASDVYRGVDVRANPARRVTELARDVYDDGLELARHCAERAAARFQEMPAEVRPDEVELSVGIKLDATLGAYIVQTAGQAQLQLTFRWKPGAGS